MADITPLVSLNGELTLTAALTGELAMPEKVWMQGPPGPQGPLCRHVRRRNPHGRKS